NCLKNGEVSNLTTTATDPDGVASMQLWALTPGGAAFVRLARDFSFDGTSWHSFIDTAKDGLIVEGRLSYRAVAIDSKGAATTSASGVITIFRCDTEASIKVGINTAVAP